MNRNINQKGTYQVIIVKTGEILDSFRTKAGATNSLPKLKDITIEVLKVIKVK